MTTVSRRDSEAVLPADATADDRAGVLDLNARARLLAGDLRAHGIGCGVLPAFRGTRVPVAEALKEQGRGSVSVSKLRRRTWPMCSPT